MHSANKNLKPEIYLLMEGGANNQAILSITNHCTENNWYLALMPIRSLGENSVSESFP